MKDREVTGWGRLFRSAFGIGAIFGLGGLLVGMRLFSQETLPHIFAPGSTADFQEAVEGLPLPQVLHWNDHLLEGMLLLANLHPIFLLFGGLALAGLLFLVVARVLDPSLRLFQLTQQPPSEETPETKGTLVVSVEGQPLRTLLRRLLWTLLPILLLWLLTGRLLAGVEANLANANTLDGAHRWERLEMLLQLLRWMGIGIALWVGLGRGREGGGEANASFRGVRNAVLGGALFGFGVACLAHYVMPGSMSQVLLRLHTLGTFHIGAWWALGGRHLLSVVSAWMGVGWLLVALGGRHFTPLQRFALIVLTLALGRGAIVNRRPYQYVAMAQQNDLTPAVMRSVMEAPYNPRFPATGVPDGPEMGRELAQRTRVALGETPAQKTRPLLLFNLRPNVVFNVRQQRFSEDGLSVDRATVEPVKQFLQQRRYQTALSWMALKHLYNVATTHFDNPFAMDVCLEGLTRCPHVFRCNRTLRAALFTCTASPENLARLDRYAKDQDFAFPDRDSKRMMGDLYRRFGATDKALHWYRRAEMPKSFLKRVQSEKPMFHTGKVQGVLRLNGKPLAGVQVGLLPIRQNGLTIDLETSVLRASREILSFRGYNELFPSLHPRPFAFRWIVAGATTDANGAFTCDHLVEGEYRLVCTLPPDVTLRPPVDPGLTVKNAPFRLTVNYDIPEYKLGNIELAYRP